MRKLTDQECQLLQLISNAGGSICPGVDVSIPREGHRSLRRMERAGLLRVEETDDGPRFHLTAIGRQEAEHG
jgi:predicted transcriptional regulator